VSNPYAPPEDRPRESAPAGDAGPGTGAAPGDTGRSPEGVPYERPRNAPPAPPRPEDLRRLARLFRATALLVLATVVADLLSFPWFVVAGPVAIVAIVVGARALLLAVQTRQRQPRMMLVLLLIIAALSLARPVTALMTWDVESTYARCQVAAITVQAQDACVTEYRQALTERVDQLTGRTPAP
jgi:hypothetical protein